MTGQEAAWGTGKCTHRGQDLLIRAGIYFSFIPFWALPQAAEMLLAFITPMRDRVVISC
jgi:hypothetical protein